MTVKRFRNSHRGYWGTHEITTVTRVGEGGADDQKVPLKQGHFWVARKTRHSMSRDTNTHADSARVDGQENGQQEKESGSALEDKKPAEKCC